MKKELLALIHAITKWRHYLIGSTFYYLLRLIHRRVTDQELFQVSIEGRSLIACLAQSTSKATPMIQDVSRELNQ